jgi:hypothetical protein
LNNKQTTALYFFVIFFQFFPSFFLLLFLARLRCALGALRTERVNLVDEEHACTLSSDLLGPLKGKTEILFGLAQKRPSQLANNGNQKKKKNKKKKKQVKIKQIFIARRITISDET